MKGVYYRVSSKRGQLLKEDRLIGTSQGVFVLTDKRLLLHPLISQKAVSLPYSKITANNCYQEGLKVHKEGGDNAFFFTMVNPVESEISGMGLDFIFQRIR